MASNTARVKILKFDPTADGAPRYETWHVPYEEGDTVLDLLTYVYENFDQDLAFRYACKKGKCGSCPVLVNGRPGFSCREPAAARLTVEPHPKFKVIKDLVVDFDAPIGGAAHSPSPDGRGFGDSIAPAPRQD